jgi:hypothetical protein
VSNGYYKSSGFWPSTFIFWAAFIAIPFYFLWNELAPVYFYWLPRLYLHIPFWHVMGLFVLVAILKTLFFPPSISINQVIEKNKRY